MYVVTIFLRFIKRRVKSMRPCRVKTFVFVDFLLASMSSLKQSESYCSFPSPSLFLSPLTRKEQKRKTVLRSPKAHLCVLAQRATTAAAIVTTTMHPRIPCVYWSNELSEPCKLFFSAFSQRIPTMLISAFSSRRTEGEPARRCKAD